MSWPPSAPEFRALCTDWSDGTDTDWEHRRIARADNQREPYLRLDDKTTKETWREKQKSRLAAMRAELGI